MYTDTVHSYDGILQITDEYGDTRIKVIRHDASTQDLRLDTCARKMQVATEASDEYHEFNM